MYQSFESVIEWEYMIVRTIKDIRVRSYLHQFAFDWVHRYF